MRREGVEDLVRDHGADDRVVVDDGGCEPVAVAGCREAFVELLETPWLDLDRPVPHGPIEGRFLGGDATEDRQSERSRASTVLADVERGRGSDRVPGIDDVAGEGPSEDRVGLRRRDEVAAAAGPRGRRPGSSREPARTGRAP